ncbi:MAG: hypothetical protein HY791_02890 [Deltaproteobacteria bacterium]|nr:hypothetical protein [Deltaproteobacteria bacterium]
MIIRELLTLLGFEVDERGVRGATDAFTSLKAKAEILKAAWDASVGAVRGWIEEAISAGDAADDTSKRLGVTAEELQELQYAANRANVSNEGLVESLKAMQNAQSAATSGSKAQLEAFRRVGISGKDLLKSTPELLDLVADGLNKLKRDSDKTAISMDLFGRGGSALIPLLKEGSAGIDEMRARARELGFVLSNEVAEQAGELDDSINDLGLRLTGLGRQMASALFPRMRELVKRLETWLKKNKELIADGLLILGNAVFWVIESFTSLADGMVNILKVLWENRRFFGILAIVIGTAFIPAIIAAIPELIMIAKAFSILIGVQLRLIATTLLAALPWIALGAAIAAIALIIEDVYVWASGGESLIGDLFKTFLDEPLAPDAHWMVKALRLILGLVRDVMTAVDEFFKGFFRDAEEMGGILSATGRLFGIGEDKTQFEVPNIERTGQNIFERRRALLAKGQVIAPMTPATAPLPGSRKAPTTGPITVEGSRTQIQVTAAPGQNASEVASEVKRKFDQSQDDHLRIAARELAGSVVR